MSSTTATFFDDLPALDTAYKSFSEDLFSRAPDDWALVVTDIVGSTEHIANGQHKTVNFVAAMAIAALKNLCTPGSIPFLFGGDGAVVMVPPEHIASARVALARLRRQAVEDFGMQVRVGLVGMAQLREFDTDVLVGRYEPSPGNSFGVFKGGGVSMLDDAIKQRGNQSLTAVTTIDAALDDGGQVDLNGLSCRWNELRSEHGKMATLIITGANDPAEIYSTIQQIANEQADSKPISLNKLSVSWPPPGLALEARARRNGGSIALSTARVLLDTFFAWVLFVTKASVGGFDSRRYRQEMTTNTDFCRFDDTLCFVVDCAETRIDAIRAFLDKRQLSESLHYGIHVSDSALMTCLVASPTDNLHVHFVDGGTGGYTEAAKQLKK
jgi:hypothetical protein